MLVVCDGWTDPRHARIVLRSTDDGSGLVSNGLCPAGESAMLRALDDTPAPPAETDTRLSDPALCSETAT